MLSVFVTFNVLSFNTMTMQYPLQFLNDKSEEN
jgi:hypothetical protein